MKNSANMKYPAKEAYKQDVVKTYDEVRFTSKKGKILDRLEKESVLIPLAKYAKKGDYIIDVPVGTGRIAEVLLENEYKVLGVDISDKMLALAREKCSRFGENFDTKVEDAENLSFPDNTFDYSTSVRLFGHLPFEIKVKILKEMLRVSKNGAFVSIYIDNGLQKLKRKLKQLIKSNPAPWYPIKKAQLHQLFTESDGVVVEKKRVLFMLSEGVTFYIKKNIKN